MKFRVYEETEHETIDSLRDESYILKNFNRLAGYDYEDSILFIIGPQVSWVISPLSDYFHGDLLPIEKFDHLKIRLFDFDDLQAWINMHRAIGSYSGLLYI